MRLPYGRVGRRRIENTKAQRSDEPGLLFHWIAYVILKGADFITCNVRNYMHHHFVPQFYLRNFRDANVPEGQEPWIWVVDFKQHRIERRAPKNVGKAANYYAFPEIEAAGGEAVESILSKIESATAAAVRRLLASDNSELEGQDRADLLFFMAVFAVRVPFFRNLTEKFAANVAKNLMQVSASDPECFEHTVREALKGKENLTPDKIEELRQWVLDDSKYTIRASPRLSIVMGFQSVVDTIYPIFDQMRWAVVRAGGDLGFITGDTPVTWVDPTLAPPFCYGLGLRGVEVTFPVSPKVALFGTWEGPTGSIRAKDPLVQEFNARRVVFAERYSFADSESGARSALDVRARMKQRAGEREKSAQKASK
jgi:hypothetical protein